MTHSNRNLETLGFNISRKDYQEIIQNARCTSSLPFVITTLNVPLLKEAHQNHKYSLALQHADCIIPDGIGIVWASKLLYGRKGLNKRITGPDLFLEFCQQANKEGLSFFFLGSTTQVLGKIRNRLHEEFPKIRLAGLYSPPFGDWKPDVNAHILEVINQAKADVLWVGMTAPKQEMWIHEHKDQLNVRMIAAIGAAFDFYAGTRVRAPRWLQKLGLEWLHRIIQEPMRIGKRYLTTIPYFLFLLIQSWLQRNK